METYNKGHEDQLKDKSENNVPSWLREATGHAYTEYPLSGGETEADFAAPPAGETKAEREGFLHDLDTNFPLSGGVEDGDTNNL